MHGLIFETSIWLLAGSTRFMSDYQSTPALAEAIGETEQPNKMINASGSKRCKQTASMKHLDFDTGKSTKGCCNAEAAHLTRLPANEVLCTTPGSSRDLPIRQSLSPSYPVVSRKS